MNAVFLLSRDHVDLAGLLRRLEAAPPPEKADVVREFQRRWDAHARAASEVFYPGLPPWASEARSRASDQHASIAGLLREVVAAGLDPARGDSLRRQVDEHIRGEQQGVFAEARERLSDELLSDLGQRIEEQRAAEAEAEAVPPERIVEAMAAVAEALAETVGSVLEIGAASPGVSPRSGARRRGKRAARSRRRR